jgi:hypothetical protein
MRMAESQNNYKNLSLSLDAELSSQLQAEAQAAGLSPEALAAAILSSHVGASQDLGPSMSPRGEATATQAYASSTDLS